MKKRYTFFRISLGKTMVKIPHQIKNILKEPMSLFSKLLFLKIVRDLLGRGLLYKKKKDI